MRALSTQNVSLRKVVISSSDMPAQAIVDVVRRFLVDHLSTSSYHLSTKTAAARGAMPRRDSSKSCEARHRVLVIAFFPLGSARYYLVFS